MRWTTRAMPALTTYAKQRILNHLSNGNPAPTICKLLKEEEIFINWVSVCKFLCHYASTGSMSRKEGDQAPLVLIAINIYAIYTNIHIGSGRPSKTTMEVKRIVSKECCKMTRQQHTSYIICLKRKG